MKVLIVDADTRRGLELQQALVADRMDVTTAESGSFALTMLEWNRHDVVVSRAHIGDMDGHELCAILKSDPGTRHVRFLLVAALDEIRTAQTMVAGVDLVVPAALPAQAVGPLIRRLVHGDPVSASAPSTPAVASPVPVPAASLAPAAFRESVPAPDARAGRATPIAPVPPVPAPAPEAVAPAVPRLRPDPVTAPVTDPPIRYVTAAAAAAAAPWTATTVSPPAPPATPKPPPPAAPVDLDAVQSGTFQGSLGVMDLAELAQAIAMGNKTGRLILALPHAGGVVVFEAGRIVHAEYRGAIGEAAFAALLTAAHAGPAGRFCFLPCAPGEKPGPARTIDRSVDQLLLSIATAIDQKG